MGKKKKGVKKGKKAKSSGSDAVEEYEIPFEINPPRKVVIIKPQLLHWNFSKKLWPEAGFELDIRTKLRTIKGMITKRHGPTESMKLWKDSNAPENLLVGDNMTLEELGFIGMPKEISPSPLAKLVTAAQVQMPKGDGSDDDEEQSEGEDKHEEGLEGEDLSEEEDEDNDDADSDDSYSTRLIYDFVPKSMKLSPLLLLSPRKLD
jgi:hypothetical protein